MDNILNLEDLRHGCSGILPSFGSFMCDCAIYSFASEGHQSGVILKVEMENQTLNYLVIWASELTIQMSRSMNDNERATDYGAMGLAILLVLQLTEYQHFTVSQKGTGIDFFLFKEEPFDADILHANARLEVSGMRKASKTNTIAIRLKQKSEQVKSSDEMGIDAYISITEFNKPTSILVTR
jgi:hypothetical protein